MRISALFIFLAISLTYGEYIPMDLAETAVQSKISTDGFSEVRRVAGMFSIEGENTGTPVAHVFRLTPCGYIITSADSRLSPVIAYSYMSCLEDLSGESPMVNLVRLDLTLRNDNIELLPREYTDQNIADWTELAEGSFRSDPLPEQWPPEGSTPTEGWLEENWTQSAPYNEYCPMDLTAGSRSLAGCPAVVMGSILNFHKLTNGTRFNDDDDYYHNFNEYYWIDDDCDNHDFPSWPELNTLLDTLEAHFSTGTVTNLDRAAVVYASGAALKQVYSASVSGTFGVDQAYDAYVRFGFDSCQLLGESADSLFEIMSQNMMDAKPVHLAIIDEGPQYGHNVVVDGYNTDGFFHINFGWGGSSNGWYSFPLTGMPYGMNIIEGAVVDIADPLQSAGDGEGGTGLGLCIQTFPNPASELLSVPVHSPENTDAEISIYSITGRLIYRSNQVLEAGTGDLSIECGEYAPGVYYLRITDGFSTDSALFTVLN